MTHQGRTQDGDGETVGLRDSTTAVLVQANAIDGHGRTVCFDQLAGKQPANRNVLAIDLQRSADQWLRDWKRDVGTPPNDIRLIVMEEDYRSPAATDESDLAGEHQISPVSNPQDLTALGIKITETIDDWERAGTETETEIVACLDSLSTMLQYTSFDSVFRFLHVFIRQLDSVGATGHFHIDPTAHDEQTITRLLQLFDAVITIEDGTVVSVQER